MEPTVVAKRVRTSNLSDGADRRRGVKRALFVLSQTDFASNGGVRSLVELLKHLRGCECRVAVSPGHGLDRELEAAGVRCELWPQLLRGGRRSIRLWRWLAANWRTWRLLRSAPIDFVHTNDRLAFWRTAFGARFACVPVVDNIRGTQVQTGPWRRAKWRVEIALAHTVLTLSQDMTARWRDTLGCGTQHWHSVYNVVDVAQFAPASEPERAELRAALGIDADDFAVLCVGVFRPLKQQLEVLRRLAPRVVEDLPVARLHFLGDFAPEVSDYAALCQREADAAHVRQQVSIHGHVEDTAIWYKAADVTLICSVQEGLARAMIESLACGTPVVSFDVASAREILEDHDCGTVVAQGEFERAADAVCDYAGDRALLLRHGRNGAATAQRLFAPEAAARAYEQAVFSRLAP